METESDRAAAKNMRDRLHGWFAKDQKRGERLAWFLGWPLWLGLTIVVGVAWFASTNETPHKGSPAVYAQIEQMTDCAELQETFDRNMADVERRQPGTFLREVVFSYANTADKRMKSLGCYG